MPRLRERDERRGLNFKYQRRSPDTWREKAKESSGAFDRYTIDGIERFSPGDSNKIRVFPPTWPNADDWAYRLFVHYGVGADEQTYLCPKQMKNEDCPICTESSRLAKDGDLEDSRNLKARSRRGCWLIDRKEPSKGPQFWAMPHTVWQGANLCAEDDDGGILELDHPEEGFDLSFKKEGTRDRTKYAGFKLNRSPSPISEDEEELAAWLKYVSAHPIPDILKFYSSEYLEEVFSGKVSHADKEDEIEEEEDERPSRSGKGDGSKKRYAKQQLDEEDEEEAEDLGEEDDEDRPVKTTKKKLEDDEDEEEEPRKGKVRRRLKEEDTEEEEEDDDDDDDERSPTTRRLERAAASVKRRGAR